MPPPTDVIARPAKAPARLRVVAARADLEPGALHPDELHATAVLVKAAVCREAETLAAVTDAFPWMQPWRDHQLWASGVWRCRVGEAEREYTAQHAPLLKFHTDMSRLPHPPEYTVIRWVAADPLGGGANLLIHIEDALRRLVELGEARLLTVLRSERRLNAADAAGRRAALVSRHPRGHTMARIFDDEAATKGLHLEMTSADLAELRRFVALCHTWTDLIVRPSLEAGDILAFSNHTFLHAREACGGPGRTTEVVLAHRGGARGGAGAADGE